MTDISKHFKSPAEFAAESEALATSDALSVREMFIDRFVDRNNHLFRARIVETKRFSDGEAYVGYLWECLIDLTQVTEHEVWNSLKPDHVVYVMWDLHSSEKVKADQYFKFPKGTVFQCSVDTLRRGLELLPEDLYIFDEDFEQAYALTHEWVNDQRYCLEARGKHN